MTPLDRPRLRRSCHTILLFRIIVALVLSLVPAAFVGRAIAQDDQAAKVEPGDLTCRPDLVGKEISVEDRVGRFQFHPNTGFDEIFRSVART